MTSPLFSHLPLGLACLVAASAKSSAAEVPDLLRIRDGLLIHLDAGRGVSLQDGLPPSDGGRVQLWEDQAKELQGNNFATVSRFRPSETPYYLASVPELNSRPALDFRNGERMAAELSMSMASSTWFVVFRADFSEEGRIIEFSNQASTFVSPAAGGSLVARGWRSTSGSSIPVDSTIGNLASRKDEFFIHSVRRSLPDQLSQRLIDREGRVLSDSVAGANANRTEPGMHVGGRSGGSSLLTGQVAEILVYNRTLSDAERLEVEAYLYDRYFGAPDADADTLPDEWELEYFSNFDQGPHDDPDGDLLTNRQEFEAGTDPTKRDTDGDGLDDARELATGSSPLLADSDGDGFIDPLEILAGTDPLDPSSLPGDIFLGLTIHSDMESPEFDRFRVRNLAGPGAGVFAVSPPELTQGLVGEALDFSNGGGISYGLRGGSGTAGMTVSLAFRVSATGGLQFLASEGNRDFSRPGWSIFLDEGVPVIRAMNVDRTASASLRHHGQVPPDEWHQVAVVFRPDGRMVPVLNGSTEGWETQDDPFSLPLSGSGSPLLLGIRDADDHEFGGALDEFSLWERALDPTEITQLHGNYASGRRLDGTAAAAPPAFPVEAEPLVVYSGQGFTLDANAPGASIYWRKNGGRIPSATGESLAITRSLSTDLGRFQPVAEDASGIGFGREALVRVPRFKVDEVHKTRAGGTVERDMLVRVLRMDGDGAAAGITEYHYRDGSTRQGLVRSLKRPPDSDAWELDQVLEAPPSYRWFGLSLALDWNTLMVSAEGWYGSLHRQGRIFVYQRSNPNRPWRLRQEVTCPDAEEGDGFGDGIVLEGDTMVAGSPGITSAYVFMLTGRQWVHRKTLRPANPELRTLNYGRSLALQDDTLVIGEARSSDPADDGTGVTHLYRRNSGGPNQWGQVQTLRLANPSGGDRFGSSVALDGRVLAINAPGGQNSSTGKVITLFSLDPVIGLATRTTELPRQLATGERESSTTVFGDQLVVDGDYLLASGYEFQGNGAAFLYRRDPGRHDNWTLLSTFTGSELAGHSDQPHFGRTRAMQGNEILASASEEGFPSDIGSDLTKRPR